MSNSNWNILPRSIYLGKAPQDRNSFMSYATKSLKVYQTYIYSLWLDSVI